MKKLIMAATLAVSAFIALFSAPAQAQLPPYGLYIMQADVGGTFFWGRYWTPANPTTDYIMMYDGTSSQPRLAALSSALSWNGTTLDVGSISQSQISGLVAALAGKYSTPTGGTGQYVRGDGSLASFPTIPTINFSLPSAKTVAVSTSYQAVDPTKPAIVTISPRCDATLTLSGGSTCSMDLRVNSTTATCSNGSVVATWTNGNTGALTIGLSLTQTMGSPYGLSLPISGRFILCPTSGTWTIQAAEQSVG